MIRVRVRVRVRVTVRVTVRVRVGFQKNVPWIFQAWTGEDTNWRCRGG